MPYIRLIYGLTYKVLSLVIAFPGPRMSFKNALILDTRKELPRNTAFLHTVIPASSLGEYCQCAYYAEIFEDFEDEDLTPEEERRRSLEIEIRHLKHKYDDDWMRYYPYHLDPDYDDDNGNPYDYGMDDDDDEDDRDDWWRR